MTITTKPVEISKGQILYFHYTKGELSPFSTCYELALLKLYFCVGEEKRRGKRRKIFGKGKDFLWGRKPEKEKEEDIWRRKIKKNG